MYSLWLIDLNQSINSFKEKACQTLHSCGVSECVGYKPSHNLVPDSVATSKFFTPFICSEPHSPPHAVYLFLDFVGFVGGVWLSKISGF